MPSSHLVSSVIRSGDGRVAGRTDFAGSDVLNLPYLHFDFGDHSSSIHWGDGGVFGGGTDGLGLGTGAFAGVEPEHLVAVEMNLFGATEGSPILFVYVLFPFNGITRSRQGRGWSVR